MKINIVEDEKKKTNKKIIPILIFIFILVVSVGAYLFINKTPSDYSVYKEKEKIYKDNNIDYSYKDYEQDKKINKQIIINTSSKTDKTKNNIAVTIIKNKEYSIPTKKLTNKSNKILLDLKNETMIDTTTDEIKTSIIQQSKDMNNFISDHCGYPDSKFGEDYKASTSYIDELVTSMIFNSKQPEPLFNQSIITMQNEIKYCIMENLQYHINSNFTQYNELLLNWMKIGHPIITNIDTISLEKLDDVTMFDSIYSNNLNAIIIFDNKKYKIYLSSQIVDGKKGIYKILDIKRI